MRVKASITDPVTEDTPPPARRRPRAIALYNVALASVAAGLGLRFLLRGVLVTTPYITLFPAVIFASWYGGFGPGLLAAVLSLVGAALQPGSPHLRFPTQADQVATVLFGGISLFICLLNDSLRRARASSEERLAALIREAASRKQTAEALRETTRGAEEARDLFRTTLAGIADAVISTDARGLVSFLNDEASRLTGYSRSEAEGLPVTEIFRMRDGQTREVVPCPVERVIRGGAMAATANHAVLMGKNGREAWIENAARPTYGAEGQLQGVVLVFRDVTDRRNSEETLRRSEERLKFALEAGRIGVWDWDVAANRIEWSDVVCEIHGLERGAFHGGVEEYAGLVHPDDRAGVEGAITAALYGGATYNIEFRVIRPGGDVGWVSACAQVFRDAENRPVRMLGATVDVTARESAVAELRQQWQAFDTALSHIPDFVYTFDPQGRFTYANRALLNMRQRPLEFMVGKTFRETGTPPELAARLDRQLQRVIETREPLRDQTAFTGGNGESRFYEYIFAPVVGEDGKVQAVAGSTRDITERNRAEEELRKSEERLTLALEAGGGVGTWDFSVADDRVYANARFAALFGVDPARASAGTSLTEFTNAMHPDDRERVSDRIRHAMETGDDFAEEYRVLRQDGSVRWVYARGRCHLDHAGQPVRFPGVVIDLTERKLAEKALRQSQEQLKAIFDGTREYIGLISPDGILLEANRASLEFAGNVREDVVGRLFWETAWFRQTPGAPEVVREGVRRAAAGELFRAEMELVRPSGERPTFEISLHPIAGDDGRVTLIVPEAQDITERKRAEDDLRRSNDDLTRANRELEEFAYVSSHDLQEPLRMVNIYTQLLLRRLPENKTAAGDAEMRQYAEYVRNGVRRMEELIQDLLLYSRVVHPEQEAAHGADLDLSLDEALLTLQARVEEAQAVVIRQPLPLVLGERRQLALVLQNLISNALKYRRADVPPRIEIGAAKGGGEWIITVRDNGIGFDPGHAEKIFGLFKRLHKDEYPGTGLGLAICRRIVERYGGSVRAFSEGEGRGAEFSVTLRAANL